MPEGHFVAMGQVGLTGWTRAAQPVARWIARRTGRPEAENLSLIGAAFLATTLIGFLRDVDAVIAAGEPPLSQRMTLRPAYRTGRGAPSSTSQPGRFRAVLRVPQSWASP